MVPPAAQTDESASLLVNDCWTSSDAQSRAEEGRPFSRSVAPLNLNSRKYSLSVTSPDLHIAFSLCYCAANRAHPDMERLTTWSLADTNLPAGCFIMKHPAGRFKTPLLWLRSLQVDPLAATSMRTSNSSRSRPKEVQTPEGSSHCYSRHCAVRESARRPISMTIPCSTLWHATFGP